MVLERMELVNVTVPVPEPVKTKAELKAEAKAAKEVRCRAKAAASKGVYLWQSRLRSNFWETAAMVLKKPRIDPDAPLCAEGEGRRGESKGGCKEGKGEQGVAGRQGRRGSGPEWHHGKGALLDAYQTTSKCLAPCTVEFGKSWLVCKQLKMMLTMLLISVHSAACGLLIIS